MTTRFDEAWSNVLTLAQTTSEQGTDVVIVRDLLGRISLVLGSPENSPAVPDALPDEVRVAAGPFAARSPVLSAREMFAADAVLNSPDLIVQHERAAGRGRLATVERGVVGADWQRPDEAAPFRRVTLYGFKGGVGRSTATFMLADHLARAGRCVLVVDLDLESPGVGALLQDHNDLPDHGIIDHLVEAAVGNADGLDLVSRSQVAAATGNGEVWIAPAGGRPRPGYEYLPKLNRVYTDLPALDGGEPRGFGRRLADAISACERRVAELSREPDVVLLDSRAGIHDIAAVAITQLSSLSLLFAADSPQTWNGYLSLFQQWQGLEFDKVHAIRQRLRMVAAMVPPATRDSYLTRFRDNALTCFEETLYDDTTNGNVDAFTFGLADISAPHQPIPIYFNSDLVGLNSSADREWHSQPLVAAAYKEFLEAAGQLIAESGTDDARS